MDTHIRDSTSIWRGMFYGFIGIASFSLTVPFTKMAMQDFSPYFITVGRVALAGIIAGLVLVLRRESIPDKAHWKKLLIISLGISIGFPLCLSLALQTTSASHAGIVLAILPLLTSILGAWVNRERHSAWFWLVAISGCATVFAYVFWKNGIILVVADAWIFAAALAAAINYSIAGGVSKRIGGMNTICWALVLTLPISVPMWGYLIWHYPTLSSVSFPPVAAFLYLALVSQFLGFVPWYAGLSIGGVARVSQVQLLQPFMTLFASVLLLNEVVTQYDWMFVILVISQVLIVKKVA